MSQIHQGVKHVVSPPDAQSVGFSLVYPFPRWDERGFVSSFNGTLQLLSASTIY